MEETMRQTSKTIGLALAIAATTTAGAMTGALAQTNGVTATEVTFGMHTDLSGVAATYGVSSSNGVKMRFDEINEAGGVNRRKIKVIIEDQGYQEPKAGEGRHKILKRHKGFRIVDPPGAPQKKALLQD